MRRLLVIALAGALIVQVPALAQAPPSSDLATGIRQVNEGDLETAVITLDGVIQRLAQEKGREKDLATAHLYLAMAHLGLSQLERAKGEMREAWRNNRGMTLDRKVFPPRVVQLYEETRREASEPKPQQAVPKSTPKIAEAPASPTPSPSPAATSQKKSGGHTGLILGIAGGAAAVAGIAVAAGGHGATSARAVSPTPLPTPTPGSVTIVLELNGQRSGNFSCRGGLFFTIQVSNTTQAAVGVGGADLSLTSLSAACTSQDFPGVLGNAQVGPNTSTQLRRIDLAGQLCNSPSGAVGCTWHAVASATGTFSGTLQDALTLTTIE